MDFAVAHLFFNGRKGRECIEFLLAEVPSGSSLIEGWAHSLLSCAGILRPPADARL